MRNTACATESAYLSRATVITLVFGWIRVAGFLVFFVVFFELMLVSR